MDESDSEVWEFEPHMHTDDGYMVKCYGGQTVTSAPAVLTSHDRGEATCPECGQVVLVVCING